MKQLALFGEQPPRSADEPRAPASLSDLFPPATGRIIADTFRFMEIAEEEIEAAKKREPEHDRELQDAFKYLRPTAVLQGLSDEVYRAHARELLDRVAAAKDLRPGTAAEVVAALAELTQAAPPGRIATLLYIDLFGQLFPAQAGLLAEPHASMEPDPYEQDRMRELEAEFRRKLSCRRDP